MADQGIRIGERRSLNLAGRDEDVSMLVKPHDRLEPPQGRLAPAAGCSDGVSPATDVETQLVQNVGLWSERL